MTTILILGAAVWRNGPSPTLLRRTRHAAALYHRCGAARLIARQTGIDAVCDCPPWAGANPHQQVRSALREIPTILVALAHYR